MKYFYSIAAITIMLISTDSYTQAVSPNKITNKTPYTLNVFVETTTRTIGKKPTTKVGQAIPIAPGATENVLIQGGARGNTSSSTSKLTFQIAEKPKSSVVLNNPEVRDYIVNYSAIFSKDPELVVE